MPERALLRIGSVSAIAGAVLGLVVNVLHPRVADPADVEALLQEVAGSTIWVGDHVGLLLFVILLIGGLASLYRSIAEEPGAAWARLGFAAALVSGGAWAVLLASDGIAMKAVAQAWANAPAAEKTAAFYAANALAQVVFGIFNIGVVLFVGVTPMLYGLAVSLSDVYPKWLGWAAIVLGLGSALIGLVQAYNGPSFLTLYVLFPIFSILVTLWVLVMGILMWRLAGAPAS